MLPLCLNPTTVKRKQHNNTADKLLAKRIIFAPTYLCCKSSREQTLFTETETYKQTHVMIIAAQSHSQDDQFQSHNPQRISPIFAILMKNQSLLITVTKDPSPPHKRSVPSYDSLSHCQEGSMPFWITMDRPIMLISPCDSAAGPCELSFPGCGPCPG